jgi:hypothetical protein
VPVLADIIGGAGAQGNIYYEYDNIICISDFLTIMTKSSYKLLKSTIISKAC